MAASQDRHIADAFAREHGRLRAFVRRRVPAASDVDDILQDVFAELIEAARLLKPIEHTGAWLFTVARHRITDLFRKRRRDGVPPGSGRRLDGDDVPTDAAQPLDDAPGTELEDLLPSADAGPEAAYARRLLLEALDEALDELPAAQRDVFVAHEL